MYCDFSFSNVAIDSPLAGVPGFNTDPSATAAKPCGTSKQTVDNDQFVPRVNITWQATDDVMTYLTYSEGFKPGGVDTTAASGDVSGDPFQPEEVETYEVGFKTSWRDNSLFGNGAVFTTITPTSRLG